MLPQVHLKCETNWRSNELIGSSNMRMGRERFISPFTNLEALYMRKVSMGRERFISPFTNLQALYMRKVSIQRFYGGQILSFFSHLTFPQPFFVSDLQKLFGSMKIWTQLL